VVHHHHHLLSLPILSPPHTYTQHLPHPPEPTHPSVNQVNRLLAHLGGKAPYLMHRLDVDTSGVLLFGKVPEVVPGVMKQFRWV